MEEEKKYQKRTRVELYADLRDKISKMDTLSFDDPNRDEKYGLNKSPFPFIEIHETGASEEELHSDHIKKNTLSISIEDLIKQNDEYSSSVGKKELTKSYKEAKKSQRSFFKEILASKKKLFLFIGILALAIVLIVLAIVLPLVL